MVTSILMKRTGACALLAACTLLCANRAAAEEASATADLGGVSTSSDGEGTSNDSAFLLAGKFGGLKSFTSLKPMVFGGIEIGWVFGGTKRRIGAMLDVSYTAPMAEGDSTDLRLEPDGKYHWELRQKILTLQPTFLYRLTGVAGPIVPYAGIGPRIYLLESVTRGTAGTATFPDTKERSTKFGFGIPLGAEYTLGPGGLFLEFLFQWGPLKHETTGETNLGAGSLMLGYRALL